MTWIFEKGGASMLKQFVMWNFKSLYFLMLNIHIFPFFLESKEFCRAIVNASIVFWIIQNKQKKKKIWGLKLREYKFFFKHFATWTSHAFHAYAWLLLCFQSSKRNCKPSLGTPITMKIIQNGQKMNKTWVNIYHKCVFNDGRFYTTQPSKNDVMSFVPTNMFFFSWVYQFQLLSISINEKLNSLRLKT